MSEATTGVARANARVSTIPKLSAERGRGHRLGAEQLFRQPLLGQEPEDLDPVGQRAGFAIRSPDGQRIGADHPECGAGPAADLRPGAEQDRQAFAGLLAPHEGTGFSRPAGSASGGISTPFGITS